MQLGRASKVCVHVMMLCFVANPGTMFHGLCSYSCLLAGGMLELSFGLVEADAGASDAKIRPILEVVQHSLEKHWTKLVNHLYDLVSQPDKDETEFSEAANARWSEMRAAVRAEAHQEAIRVGISAEQMDRMHEQMSKIGDARWQVFRESIVRIANHSRTKRKELEIEKRKAATAAAVKAHSKATWAGVRGAVKASTMLALAAQEQELKLAQAWRARVAQRVANKINEGCTQEWNILQARLDFAAKQAGILVPSLTA